MGKNEKQTGNRVHMAQPFHFCTATDRLRDFTPLTVMFEHYVMILDHNAEVTFSSVSMVTLCW